MAAGSPPNSRAIACKKTFGLFEIHAFDFPDDLMFLRRTIQHVIRLGDDTGILDGFEGLRAAVVQVEIDMPDGLDVFLGPSRGIFLERVHPYIDVRAVRVLVAKPRLELGACGFLRTGDALDGFAEVPVEHQHGNAVGGLEIVENVFRSGWNKRCWIFQRDSYKLLVTVENEAVVVFIAIGIVAVDFHDFGNEAPARPAFEVHDDIYGITDIRLDGAVR